MFYSKRTVLTNLAIALALYLAWLLFNALTGCARVPVAVTSPGVGGQPAQVAYMTTLGGKVNVTPSDQGHGWAIVTDHEKSFTDGAQLAGKVVTWSALAKIAETAADAIVERADTLTAAEQAARETDAASDLNLLTEQNDAALQQAALEAAN